MYSTRYAAAEQTGTCEVALRGSESIPSPASKGAQAGGSTDPVPTTGNLRRSPRSVTREGNVLGNAAGLSNQIIVKSRTGSLGFRFDFTTTRHSLIGDFWLHRGGLVR